MADPPEEVTRWLAAARGGLSEALGQVLEACRGYLLRIANRRLGADLRSKGGALDLVQQTFLDAQCQFERFRGESETERLAWLRQILLHNLAHFQRRYRATGKRDLGREAPLAGEASSTDGGADLAAQTPSPSEQIAARRSRGRAASPGVGKELPGGDAFAAYSPDGRWLVNGTKDEYRFWEVGSWRPGLRIPRTPEAIPGPLAFTTDGKIRAITHSLREVRLIEMATGRELATLTAAEPYPIRWLCFRPDGEQLAVACANHVLQLWDLRRIRERLAGLGWDWE